MPALSEAEMNNHPNPVGAGPRVCPVGAVGQPPSPRGGPRPGAGAPKGNLNALKHGQRSEQLRDLAQALAQVPHVRDLLIHFARRQARQRRQAERTAHSILSQFFWALPELTNNQAIFTPIELGPPLKTRQKFSSNQKSKLGKENNQLWP